MVGSALSRTLVKTYPNSTCMERGRQVPNFANYFRRYSTIFSNQGTSTLNVNIFVNLNTVSDNPSIHSGLPLCTLNIYIPRSKAHARKTFNPPTAPPCCKPLTGLTWLTRNNFDNSLLLYFDRNSINLVTTSLLTFSIRRQPPFKF